MPHLTEGTKVLEIIGTELRNELPKLLSTLSLGNLHETELWVREMMMRFGDEVLGELIEQCATAYCSTHVAPRGTKCSLKKSTIRLSSGVEKEIMSPYYGRLPAGYQGSRRPLEEHWNVWHKNSPLLCDIVGHTTMICPSYELSTQQLNKTGVRISTSSARKITQQLAERCAEAGEAEILIADKEWVAGKLVVISADGGRTRIREGKGEGSGGAYDTPWREPKLFVIDILNGKGGIARHELPLYGCRFDEGEMIALLGSYLKKIGIHTAARVQLIADGATWIWKRVPVLLDDLGVKKKRISETLDHYHALEYVHALIRAMPLRIGKKERAAFVINFKEQIWQGKCLAVVKQLRGIFLRPSKEVKRWINYLEKHANRMQYADYESKGLMCGSGLMESAVRRVINLRFKNAATFWLKENVEKLYFLRGALLSKRWDIVIGNLLKISK